MAKLLIYAKMILLTSAGPREIPGAHSPHGSRVGDVTADGVSLVSGMEVANLMEIGSALTRLVGTAGLGFSRRRDQYSVDLSEASNNPTFTVSHLQFVVRDADNEDSAVLTVATDHIGYISHTKTNNPSGLLERIGLHFSGTPTIVYGHTNMRAVAAAVKALNKAGEDAKARAAGIQAIGAVGGTVGLIAGNVIDRLRVF